MSKIPSTTNIPFYEPLNLEISETIADNPQSIILSRRPDRGNVLQVEVSGYDDHGEVTAVKISGNFHDDGRQNDANMLARLRSMVKRSEQENRHLILISPHAQIEMRGRVQNLTGPSVASSPHPVFFTYSFDFVAEPEPRQPKHFRKLIEVVPVEGKPYVTFTIPSSDFTDIRDLAFAYWGQEYTDDQKIAQIIALNKLTMTQERTLTIGSEIKLPLK